jgi:RNA polymerase sigma-70 factor (ECF subfamily)
MDHTDTQHLLREYAAGRTEPFTALYARIAEPLYVWCAVRIPRALWHRLHPEDLMQEVWYRALHNLDRFDPNRASLRAWMFGIAANTLAHELRRLHVRRREQPSAVPEGSHGTAPFDRVPADVTSIAQSTARAESVQKLVEEVARLDVEDRELLLARGCEGQSHAEIGARLHISPEAAEIRWRRLKERIRNLHSLRDLGEA